MYNISRREFTGLQLVLIETNELHNYLRVPVVERTATM